MLLVSQERWRQHEAAAGDGWPLTVAPELVVEILSTIDRELALENKLRDYCRISVSECWVVRPEEKTVEVLRLTPDAAEPVATYSGGEVVNSDALPDLTVADIFMP